MLPLHYLAYGSNLHPLRLMERVPSARVIDVIPMPDHAVTFHKRSNDRSGKCNLLDLAGHTSYGVLYEFRSSDKGALDSAEGLGHGYREALVSCSSKGSTYQPYVYVANASHIDTTLHPYHWYKALVLAGARYHHFPADYVGALDSVASIPDPDKVRASKNEALLSRMAAF